MSNYNKTPIIQQPRDFGGTLYVFPSAHEDIGLNLNYRVNSVALSHYALLNIPTAKTNTADEGTPKNHFNPNLIPGHYGWRKEHSSQSEGAGFIIASSLQNYAMNFETLLLNQDDYNYSDPHTVSERVFWKWLKETGAIRWKKVENSRNTYTEADDDGYEKVVRCFGVIDAGNSVSSEFGMFNETYVTIPTSYGGGKTFFKIYDSETDLNYKLNHIYVCSNQGTNLEGRDSSLKDYAYTVNVPFTDYTSESGIEPKYLEGPYALNSPAYVTQPNFNEADSDASIDSSVIYKLDDTETELSFLRSNLDGVELVKDIPSLQRIFNDISEETLPTIMSYDDINIKDIYAPDASFGFNAVLLYYSVYDNNNVNRTPVATNLFGILFLDSPIESVDSENNVSFEIPALTKKKSGIHGFGTGYSFRINVKTLSVYDNSEAYINDNTTANSVLVNDFSGVIKNLNKAVENMNVNVETTRKIQENYVAVRNYYDALKTNVNDMDNKLNAYISGKNTNILDASYVYTQNLRSGTSPVNTKSISISVPTNYESIDSSESYKYEPIYTEVANIDSEGIHAIGIDSNFVDVEFSYTKVKEYSGDVSSYSGYADTSVNELLDAMFNGTNPSLQINLASVQPEGQSINNNIEITDLERQNYYELYVSPDSSALLDTASMFNLSHLIKKDSNVTYIEGRDLVVTEMSIDYAKMVPYLIAYIQKLTARVQALENAQRGSETV